jgi:hypothetical protein
LPWADFADGVRASRCEDVQLTLKPKRSNVGGGKWRASIGPVADIERGFAVAAWNGRDARSPATKANSPSLATQRREAWRGR